MTSPEWDRAHTINEQIFEFEELKKDLPSQIAKCRQQLQTSMGEVHFDQGNINSFNLRLPLAPRYVISDAQRVALEYNVFYQDLLSKKTHAVFQFYLVKLGDDFLFTVSPDDKTGFAMFNNNLETKILGEYHKALLDSAVFAPL